ncbi:tRNA epoxyqueuosine(34) reductase QueG [Pelagibius litoralis]|uniref:Epoxyqueuosine reductase n=1 Tax=Pelagibius litoralis TaxID=374515 RepID=A0A967EZ70_9PROT|nr:tRNA epoxyqueuosine(34) reductase QueG [Pelagibius litoralis]NIA70116.1 tRNA epoxyqueuosine(34) reductase QueG [Pelagibius litoralis]
MEGQTAKAAIRAKALTLGFDAVGFARPEVLPEARAGLMAFLEAGYHGEMDWLARNADRRSDPKVLWPEARSVIVLGQNYGPRENPLALLDQPRRAAVSVYARNADYHDLMKKRLKALARWIHQDLQAEVKVFVDTAPVMEKHLAQAGGLGWQGKHSNLVSRDLGSWLFLGEVYTTLALAPDEGESDHCGSCRSCLDVCPTAAFPEPYRLDARRCISYLTIEHKGHIAREFRKAMGNRIYGCDDCLAVCPWNKFAQPTKEAAFLPRAELTAPRLTDLLELDDAGFRRVFAGSPIKRIGRDRFIRNVLIALGNAGDSEAAAAIEAKLVDPSPLVRAMAIWALSQLLPKESADELRSKYGTNESDPGVLEEWDQAT